MDVTHYLKTYGMTAYQLAQTIILDVQDHIGITATAGIGTNLYLCKIAMDIVAKHIDADENGVRMPSFFGYIGWSLVFLVPVFILDMLVFFM